MESRVVLTVALTVVCMCAFYTFQVVRFSTIEMYSCHFGGIPVTRKGLGSQKDLLVCSNYGQSQNHDSQHLSAYSALGTGLSPLPTLLTSYTYIIYLIFTTTLQ